MKKELRPWPWCFILIDGGCSTGHAVRSLCCIRATCYLSRISSQGGDIGRWSCISTLISQGKRALRPMMHVFNIDGASSSSAQRSSPSRRMLPAFE